MKKAAIDKARSRLEQARQAFRRIQTSGNFDEFERAWAEFLAAIKGVHSIFEASANPKKDPKAYGWYAQKIGERRKDPLLRYVHAARNAEEYGLEPIARHEPGFTAIGIGGEPVHIKRLVMEQGRIVHAEFVPVNGKLPTIISEPSRVRLITVKDERYGDTFDPPREHLGKPLKSDDAGEVAELALKYHDELIQEAEKYVE